MTWQTLCTGLFAKHEYVRHFFFGINKHIKAETKWSSFRRRHFHMQVHIMAWRRKGDKPLFESMLFNLLTYICATGPQWVKLPRSMLRTRECVTTSQHFISRDIQSICIKRHISLLKKALHQRANSLICIDVKYRGRLIWYLHGTYSDYTALGRALNIPDQWMLRDWT